MTTRLLRASAPNVLELEDVHDATLRQNTGARAYLNTGTGTVQLYRANGTPIEGASGDAARVAAVPGKWEARLDAIASAGLEGLEGQRVEARWNITGDVEGGATGVTAPVEAWYTVAGAASRYDPTGHGLLSERARALAPEELVAQAKLAETILGLEDLDVTADSAKVARAQMAVALQVNLQLASPAEAMALTSQSRGGRSESYRDGIPLVHPTAASIVRQLMGGPTFRRTRGARELDTSGDDRHERLRGTPPRGPHFPWGS